MGLSVSIGGAIIIFTISYMIMMFPSILDTTTSLTNTSTQRANLDNVILKSDIRLSEINGTALSNVVNFEVQNIGNEKLWEYDKFNLIITYDGGIATKTTYTEYFTFEKICSDTVGKWCITSIKNDAQDPKILNFAEALKAKAVVSHPLYTNGVMTALISTDNGITAERTNRVS